jgi:hypothetical protein
MEKKKDGYSLSNQWFEFADDNPEKMKPVHGILWHYLIALNNKCGWKEKFGVPAYDTMRMIGVSSYNTYIKAFNDLISWGFIRPVTKSKNQHTANIIALVKFTKAKNSALSNFDKAQVQHSCSTVVIDKLNKTIKTLKIEERAANFRKDIFSDEFLEKYGKPMLEAFFTYWAEPNRGSTKMRMELQQTWQLSGRLATWHGRETPSKPQGGGPAYKMPPNNRIYREK